MKLKGVSPLIAVVMLIAFTLVVAGILVYFMRKVRALKHGLFEKQVRETQDRIHQNFSEIRRDLTEELKALVANADKHPLTPEEIQRQEHILRELENMERNMERDMGDIEKRY